ncbi:DUF2079 domain-containing protein [Streptomyces sp. NPDC059874]|uniref:DUF2079 domain-containing protein n=1 Tax=Streptomyces sp. NPDC059874 TaxID=3346983 RepID=UPI00364F87E9
MWQLVQPASWQTDPRMAVARGVMAKIPDGARVQASNNLGPHLADRTSVSVYGWGDSRPNPEWIMVDTLVAPNHRWPLSVEQEELTLDIARVRGYRAVVEKDGFVLLSRTGWQGRTPTVRSSVGRSAPGGRPSPPGMPSAWAAARLRRPADRTGLRAESRGRRSCRCRMFLAARPRRRASSCHRVPVGGPSSCPSAPQNCLRSARPRGARRSARPRAWPPL